MFLSYLLEPRDIICLLEVLDDCVNFFIKKRADFSESRTHRPHELLQYGCEKWLDVFCAALLGRLRNGAWRARRDNGCM